MARFSKGGRGCKTPYESTYVRVPVPIKGEIELICWNYRNQAEVQAIISNLSEKARQKLMHKLGPFGAAPSDQQDGAASESEPETEQLKVQIERLEAEKAELVEKLKAVGLIDPVEIPLQRQITFS